MDGDEASSLKAHLDFDRYYEKWDENRPSERLLPSKDGETL